MSPGIDRGPSTGDAGQDGSPSKKRKRGACHSSAAAAVTSSEANDFASLGLRPWLVATLKAVAITRPTQIQRDCIPQILNGRDCIGGSRTGTGKTVAFAAPILQKWAEDPSGIYALVLTPTRELALQIYEQVRALSAPQSLKAVLVIGGGDLRAQAIELAQRPHIVIGTPGRLADHIAHSGSDTVGGLCRVRFLVLDEADRLLAAGRGSMLPDVERCLAALPAPAQRQTCLFTATVTAEVHALAALPRPPGRPAVFVSEAGAGLAALPPGLRQTYLKTPVTHKEHYLHVLLSTAANAARPAIVFCNKAKTATVLEYMLRLLGHRVTALHARLPQPERTANLARFRALAARVLVATDLASRGLDVPDVALVVNYDLPRDPDDYIHRVGRTARAGRPGTSVTLVGQRDVDLVLAIERRVGSPMAEYEEERVSIEGRVVRDSLKIVNEKKREALLAIDEGRDVRGKRTRVKERFHLTELGSYTEP